MANKGNGIAWRINKPLNDGGRPPFISKPLLLEFEISKLFAILIIIIIIRQS